jgi:nucleotide-binding universal stress UspA family protein
MMALKARHEREGRAILGKARDLLLKKGFPQDQVETLALTRRIGLARDILLEAGNRMVDALVVGRRSRNRMEELFMGSVSAKVLEGAKGIPVWIVGGPIHSHQILVAVDGSENAFRAVDHVGFIMGGQKDLKVTLFYALPLLSRHYDLKGVEYRELLLEIKNLALHKIHAFMEKACEDLVNAGVDRGNIRIKLKKRGMDVAQAILDEARKEKYGTIVVGRRGISKTQEFFLGSISRKVVQQAGHLAVWVVS